MLYDETAVARAHIAARARTNAEKLLEALGEALDLLEDHVGPGIPRIAELRAMRNEIVGNDLVQPCKTGPHVYTPSGGVASGGGATLTI